MHRYAHDAGKGCEKEVEGGAAVRGTYIHTNVRADPDAHLHPGGWVVVWGQLGIDGSCGGRLLRVCADVCVCVGEVFF